MKDKILNKQLQIIKTITATQINLAFLHKIASKDFETSEKYQQVLLDAKFVNELGLYIFDRGMINNLPFQQCWLVSFYSGIIQAIKNIVELSNGIDAEHPDIASLRLILKTLVDDYEQINKEMDVHFKKNNTNQEENIITKEDGIYGS